MSSICTWVANVFLISKFSQSKTTLNSCNNSTISSVFENILEFQMHVEFSKTHASFTLQKSLVFSSPAIAILDDKVLYYFDA